MTVNTNGKQVTITMGSQSQSTKTSMWTTWGFKPFTNPTNKFKGQ